MDPVLPFSFDDEWRGELAALEAAGLRRKLVSRSQGATINLASNDYLGLSHHPLVLEATKKALEKDGTGSGSSRLMAGTLRVHEELESSLASFLGKAAALVYPSGYHVNTGLLPTLVGPSDVVLFDRFCHASFIDGVKLSGARFASYDHNDVNDLETLLKRHRSTRRRAIIATEGFFSMDGDLPPLSDIVALARRWNAWVYLDEAHSLGITGPGGRGVAAQAKLLSEIDIFVGTLSKSLGAQGGFVAGSRPLIDFLISKGRSFIYTTALAPSAAAAALAALQLLPTLDNRRGRVHEAAQSLRTRLQRQGYDTLQSASPIVPVWTGDVAATQALSRHLFETGFFVPSIRPPTVPEGEGRVRLSITHDVAAEHETALSAAFESYPTRPQKRGSGLVQLG